MSDAPEAAAPPPPSAPPAPTAAAAGFEDFERPSSEAPVLATAVVAAPLYLLVVWLASRAPRYLHDLLLERGWVTHAILILTSVAVAILAIKLSRLRAQRRFSAITVAPGVAVITPEAVPEILRHLADAQRVAGGGASFLVERARRVLGHFVARRDPQEANAFHAAEADAEAGAIGASFSPVKILVWAIPILGFIGTVLGIGDAVAAFSGSLDGAARVDALRTSLGAVTAGLAVAFDTTLVALVASLLVMLPASALQKAEEQLSGDVDERLRSELLPRLAARPAEPAAPVGDWLGNGARSSAGPLAGPLAELLAAQVRLVAELRADREALRDARRVLHEELTAFAQAAGRIGPSVERAVVGLEIATGVAERATGVAERANRSAERVSEQLARELGASRGLLQLLAAGLGDGARANANDRRPSDPDVPAAEVGT